MMNIPFEDTYFFDRDLAYQTALAHNTITSRDGQKLEQVCYYDGEPFSLAPNNLIHVPVEYFSEYFHINSHRIPTHIESSTTNKQVDLAQLKSRFKSIMNAVQKLSKKN